jgi:hypothetical protein
MGWQLSLVRVKSHEIKSLKVIIGVSKRNWKNKGLILPILNQKPEMTRHQT